MCALKAFRREKERFAPPITLLPFQLLPHAMAEVLRDMFDRSGKKIGPVGIIVEPY